MQQHNYLTLQSPLPSENSKLGDAVRIANSLSAVFDVQPTKLFVQCQDNEQHEVDAVGQIMQDSGASITGVPLHWFGQWDMKNSQRYIVNLATAALCNNIRVVERAFAAG